MYDEDDGFYDDHYDDTEDVIYEDYDEDLQAEGNICGSDHFLCHSKVRIKYCILYCTVLYCNVTDTVLYCNITEPVYPPDTAV